MPRIDRHPRDLNEDGASDIPLHRLPGFGTGLHRQRVAFVKAGEASDDKAATPATATSSGGSVADMYLSIVMGGATNTSKEVAASAASAASVCEICRLPTMPSPSSSTPKHHDACLVHQVALQHSKPPSSLDRSRFGLAIMSAQGWDPDSGRGLGRDQQGMPYPIAAQKRLERQALGDRRKDGKTPDARPKTKKDLKRMEHERRRRHDRLREQIMGNRDLDKYLRPQE